MAGALKKLLAKLELRPGDLLTLRAPLGADMGALQAFAQEVHDQTGHLVLITTPGFTLEALGDEALTAAGLIRIAPQEAAGASIDALEELAHATVRQTYQRVREMAEAEREAATAYLKSVFEPEEDPGPCRSD